MGVGMSNFDLAVPRPIIAPSDAEREAVALMSTMSTEGCEEKAKAARLKATLTSDAEPSPAPPIWLQRQHDEDVLAIQQKIDQLKSGEK